MDSTHEDVVEHHNSFVLVDEPYTLEATTLNTEDQKHSATKSTSVIQTLDENVKNVPQTLPYNVKTSHNSSFLIEQNTAPLMASEEHWKTTSQSFIRNNEEVRHHSLQQRESLASAPGIRAGDIFVGSDQKRYRLHRGPPGPIGPQGKRVSISVG